MKATTSKLNDLLPVWHNKLGLDKTNGVKIIYVKRIKFQTNLHKVREINYKPVY